MKRAFWVLSIIGLPTVLNSAAWAQEPRADGQRPGRSGDTGDRPEMRRMMMPPPLILGGQWKAAEDGVFVLQPGRLLKYDPDLKLVKTVDLPRPTPVGERKAGVDDGRTDASGQPGGRAGRSPGESPERAGRMREMMARAPGGLAPHVEVTRSAVFVSEGNLLLRYDHDLNLQKKAELPQMKPMESRPGVGRERGGVPEK